MAFVANSNTKYLKILKFRKLTQTESVKRRFSLYKRNSACVFWIDPTHQNHTTVSSHLKSCVKLPNQFSGLTQHRFVSTGDHGRRLEELSSLSKDSSFAGGSDALHASSAKVLFVDSATDMTEKRTSIDSHSASSGVDTSSDLTLAAASNEVDIASSPVDISSDALSSIASSDVLSTAAELAEPSLASLGLASSYTPVGIVQQLLELMHINSYLPMPWWLTIVTGTVIARVLMFPIFVKTQRNSAKFAYVMPQLQVMQAKFNEARRSGNSYEAMRMGQEIGKFMRNNEVNPIKNALLPMSQFPVFISYFLALRNMAKLPVESMKAGGFWWITDLTIPDPYFIMPLCCCSTLFVVLKLGADTGIRMENMKMARYFLMAMPVILFPFCINFPSAVLFYWCTNNFLTLGLVLMLKHKGLRAYFDVPEIKKPDQSLIPKKKGFVEGMKEAFEDQRAIRSIDDRRRVDEIRFRKAGTGPIPRTYSYDPTKPRPAEAAATAAAKMHSKTKS